jgi:hypothetical protein
MLTILWQNQERFIRATKFYGTTKRKSDQLIFKSLKNQMLTNLGLCEKCGFLVKAVKLGLTLFVAAQQYFI